MFKPSPWAIATSIPTCDGAKVFTSVSNCGALVSMSVCSCRWNISSVASVRVSDQTKKLSCCTYQGGQSTVGLFMPASYCFSNANINNINQG